MNIQLKKGVIELLVLAQLVHKDCYGYEIVAEVSKHMEISEGTIYPLLNRLKRDLFVETYLAESNSGPPRKYYKMTEMGKRAFLKMRDEWIVFSEAVNQLLNEVK
ncbi:MAG: PadR family transcriptional regulator [Megasphaera sp.]|jgi:PadR family transcriptional regulator PadR|uniref:PadR family transcriptional regulator, regulatory protein PadR n=1 Tax=Megasphaera paucivorans TaxID=349095 RepID=A0A1G9SD41_9FIRM|nr:PadR family transcriptional regulator [Megasphaera paucivorans]MCI1821638.1 PadR family transcriptional regulator [Megasphaera sp.]MCI1823265.1 PadR family transcriptional regulator [Megasphaera sp.]SDM33413.1 PadR family transcriptional regulator, regulatory protein PadR [Megasphaera paucivorans]